MSPFPSLAAKTFAAGLAVCCLAIAQDAPFQSFTASGTIVMYSASGAPAQTRTQDYAVRSDGSQALSLHQIDLRGERKTHKTVYDVPGAARLTTDDLTESSILFPMKDLAGTTARRARECLRRPLADATILDYAVRVEEAVPTPSGGVFRTVRYLAPALNCYALREEAYRSAGDETPILIEVKQATSVIEGEPPDEAFATPTSYTARTPTEMLREYGRRYPDRALSEDKIDRLSHLDRAHRIANAGR
ncbi:MAG: hypothetical protein GC160_12090 [Acidobacteria bacterium]|nr:hypothetical protein [Acidobacteriota bacterium]